MAIRTGEANTLEITGLECGTAYDFRVSAFGNGEDDGYLGVWSGAGTVTGSTSACIPVISIALRDPSDPVNPHVNEGDRVVFVLTSTIAPQTSSLNVNVSVTDTGSFISSNIPSVIGFGVGSTSESLILDTAPDGMVGADGTITATIDSGTGYKPNALAGSDSVAVRNTEVRLGQPIAEVIPTSLRRAYLVWPAVAEYDSNTRYDIVVRPDDPNANWAPTAMGVTTQPDGSGFYEIKLDEIILNPSPVGLADFDYFEFQITASDRNNVKLRNTSSIIRVVDNPLLQEGGKAYFSNQAGKAYLEWRTAATATNYSIDYRQLDYDPDGGSRPGRPAYF